MKKVLFIAILLLVVVGLFAQSGGNVTDFNGNNWIQWNRDQKFFYVLGFLSAHSSIAERFRYEAGSEVITKDEQAFINETFIFPYNTSELIDRVDRYYSDSSVRHYPIHNTILFISGKDYWNY